MKPSVTKTEIDAARAAIDRIRKEADTAAPFLEAIPGIGGYIKTGVAVLDAADNAIDEVTEALGL